MARKDISDRQVVEAARDAKAVGYAKFTTDLLMERTGQCVKVCWRALERAEDRALIECGTSLRGAWPTDRGLALLDEVK
jgi:hypothetical protein